VPANRRSCDLAFELILMFQLRSPIVSLENAIAAAAFRIAPEREAELGELRDNFELSFTFDDGPGFQFWVGTTSREITTTIASLEFLWASSHAHIVLYDEYRKAQRAGCEQFNTGGNSRCKNALDLLSWAVRNLNSYGTDEWPQDLPRPVQFPEHGSDVRVTNELFLCGVAWIVHHEIAHIRLGHTPVQTNRSQVEEFEADLEATKWMLEHSSVDAESQKRTLGIATAMLSIMGIERDRDFNVSHSHPVAFERLYRCLDIACVEENDNVFAFASVIMQIQLWYSGKAAAYEGDSLKDMFCSYLLEYARR
jgi:hypothetical protein